MTLENRALADIILEGKGVKGQIGPKSKGQRAGTLWRTIGHSPVLVDGATGRPVSKAGKSIRLKAIASKARATPIGKKAKAAVSKAKAPPSSTAPSPKTTQQKAPAKPSKKTANIEGFKNEKLKWSYKSPQKDLPTELRGMKSNKVYEASFWIKRGVPVAAAAKIANGPAKMQKELRDGIKSGTLKTPAELVSRASGVSKAPAAKPVTPKAADQAKPVVKPATEKPVAAKPAPKPVEKPATEKPVAAKPVTKPVEKPTTEKPVAAKADPAKAKEPLKSGDQAVSINKATEKLGDPPAPRQLFSKGGPPEHLDADAKIRRALTPMLTDDRTRKATRELIRTGVDPVVASGVVARQTIANKIAMTKEGKFKGKEAIAEQERRYKSGEWKSLPSDKAELQKLSSSKAENRAKNPEAWKKSDKYWEDSHRQSEKVVKTASPSATSKSRMKDTEDWHDSLSSAEKSATSQFFGTTDYKGTRAYERNSQAAGSTPNYAAFRSAIDRAPTYSGTMVRGMAGLDAAAFQSMTTKGGTFTLKHTSSFSADAKHAGNFGTGDFTLSRAQAARVKTGTNVIIKVVKGGKAMDTRRLNPAESEVLTAGGAKFRIIRTSTKKVKGHPDSSISGEKFKVTTVEVEQIGG